MGFKRLVKSSESELTKAGANGPPSRGSQAGDLARGVKVIRRQLKTLSGSPGVYRMLDKDGEVLYVGKAKHLRNRVASY